MVEVKKLWRCEKCSGLYDSQKEAVTCAASHIHPETWVFGKDGDGYRVFSNCAPNSFGSLEWAMKKARGDK